MIAATPVAQIVAEGKAELGFQQIAELKPVPGVDLLGPIPESLQSVTIFSAGVVNGSLNVDAAQGLIAFLDSPQSAPVVQETGLEPISK